MALQRSLAWYPAVLRSIPNKLAETVPGGGGASFLAPQQGGTMHTLVALCHLSSRSNSWILNNGELIETGTWLDSEIRKFQHGGANIGRSLLIPPSITFLCPRDT